MLRPLRKDEKPEVEAPAPDHVKSHPTMNGGTFGIMTAENPRFESKVKGENRALEDQLKHNGLRYERTVGKYDSPENSYVIHNPTREQMLGLGKDFGQESVIYSSGGNHEMHYTNGPSLGHYVAGHPDQPASYFNHQPSNFWTAMPGDTGFFRLNFDPEWKLNPLASAPNLQAQRKSENMATNRSMQDLKKALADRLKKAEADLADLGRREAKLVKSEPVDPHLARAESTVLKMSEQDKQVLADRHGYTARWHRETKKMEGDGRGPDYRKSRDAALKEHFAKSYASAAGFAKHAGHMEPGVHENAAPGEVPHAEPGGHEMAAMPMPDSPPEEPINSSIGLPAAELQAPAQTMPQPSAMDPQAGVVGATRSPQVGAGADLCPLCAQPDMPGSCTCLQAAQAAPMALSEESPVAKNFLDEGGDGAQEPSCPMCHGPGKMLGSLGAKEHFMCRNCGVGFHREAPPDEQIEEVAAPMAGGVAKSGDTGADMGSGTGYAGAGSMAMSEVMKNALSGYGPKAPGAGPAAAPGMAMSDKEPHHQPSASPDQMSMKEETPGEHHGREESSSASAAVKSEMCKACGKSHELGKCMKSMAKATDFVNVDGKHKSVGVPGKAKLPPASPENQGPGLSGPASKEMSPAGSGGEKKPVKKADPPMAKPPSGKNPATMTPTAKPAAPKVGGAPGGSAAIKAEELAKPPVSQAQRGAMGAAAGGNSTLGIPKKVGKEFMDADKGGKLPETKKAAIPMAAPKAGPSMGAKMMGGGATGLTSPNDPSRANTHAAAMGGAFQPKGPINSGLELAPKKPAGMQAPTSQARTPGGSGALPKPPGLARSADEKNDMKKADLGNCLLCNRPEHAGSCEQ